MNGESSWSRTLEALQPGRALLPLSSETLDSALGLAGWESQRLMDIISLVREDPGLVSGHFHDVWYQRRLSLVALGLMFSDTELRRDVFWDTDVSLSTCEKALSLMRVLMSLVIQLSFSFHLILSKAIFGLFGLMLTRVSSRICHSYYHSRVTKHSLINESCPH